MSENQFPSVDALARCLDPSIPEVYRIVAARKAIAQAKNEKNWPGEPAVNHTRLLAQNLAASTIVPVINMSGTVLHTGLGRARLAPSAVEAIAHAATGHASLEFELDSGRRGSRQSHVNWLLKELTGCESAFVVNNCAAALVLALAALAKGKEVILSRSQMVQIGGGFRIPTIIQEAGCHLVEVGCTNFVSRQDYISAINENTAAILQCHKSNFAMSGFVSETSPPDIAKLALDNGIPFVDDLGSGCIVDTTAYGLPKERTLTEALTNGADIVLASGDKLLGGPQAGIILGKSNLIEKISQHPLARTFRIDKLDLIALEATLRLYLEGRSSEIPVWKYTGKPLDEVRDAAQKLQSAWPGSDITESMTEIGGGSLPGAGVPTLCCTIDAPNLNNLHERIRTQGKIVGSVRDGLLWLDPRTAESNEVDQAAQFLKSIAP